MSSAALASVGFCVLIVSQNAPQQWHSEVQ